MAEVKSLIVGGVQFRGAGRSRSMGNRIVLRGGGSGFDRPRPGEGIGPAICSWQSSTLQALIFPLTHTLSMGQSNDMSRPGTGGLPTYHCDLFTNFLRRLHQSWCISAPTIRTFPKSPI